LTGLREGVEKVMSFLLGEREWIHILLKCKETNEWRKQFKKKLELNEEITQTIGNSKTLELENLGTFFIKQDANGNIN
jgi:hypothetical protein